MKMNVGKKMTVIVAIALGVSWSAKAISSYDYTLGEINFGGYTGPYATAEVDLTSSTTANITFTGLTSSVGGYVFLIGDPGVNVNGTGFTISGTSPGSYSASSGNEDGWGSFNLIVNTPNGSSHALPSVSFTLTDTTADWLSADDVLTVNGGGNYVAAHIYVFNPDGTATGDTGYAADNNPGVMINTNSFNAPDGGATAMMLGLAVSGLALIRRKLS